MQSTNQNSRSSEQKHLEMFQRISARTLNAKDKAHFMQDTLADIGQTLQVSRTYILEKTTDSTWSNTFEWVADGVEPCKDLLQNFPIAPWLEEGEMLHIISNGKPYIVDSIDNVQKGLTRDELIRQNIISLITVPIFSKKEIIGLLGVDQCKHEENWTEHNINTMIILGSLLNNAKAYFRTQRVFQKKKEQVQNLFDAFPYPIYVTTMDDYRILFCNKAISDLFDISDFSKIPCYKLFQNLDEPCPFCTNHLLKHGDPPHIWHHHNPITKRDYKILDRCMTWEHHSNARLSIALDISDSLRLQREQVLEREANTAKGLFLANMSHELRTPLNGIIGMTHLAEAANKHKIVGDYLEKIQISSNNLLGIINEILDFSKIEENEITLEYKPFSLTEILFEAQAILQASAERKGLYLQCIMDDNIPNLLEGDSLRLSQVVLNLTNNAIKFTENGGVTLEIQAMAVENLTHHIRLLVKDTGIGIASEDADKLFVEYAQAESSTSRRFGGTGLGLSIVKRLVELMGGSIYVQSVLGEGSSFICDIPFTIYDECVNITEQINTPPALEEDINGTRILLVEDNEINALIATEVLEQYGCIVHGAEDGSIALSKLENNEYDLVLMDIQMPNMDGLEATRYIREKACYDTLPILAMSAHAQVQDHEKSLEAGMQEHLTKPFIPQELRSVIYKYTNTPFVFSKK